MSQPPSRPPREHTADYAAFVLDAFGAADYEIDLVTGTLRASPRLNELYGYPADHPLTLADCRERYHPADREDIAAVIATTMAAGTTRSQRAVRLMLPDGSVRWLLSRGEISLDAAGKPVLVHGAAIDITEQKRAEAALRESMVRQDYLVRLGDALRPLADPISVQNTAARLLTEQLGASRTYYYEYDEDTRIGTVQQAYVRRGEHAIVGTYRLDAFPLAHAVLHANQALIFADAHSAPDLTAAERDQYAALDIRAIICVPLLKHGKLVAVCVVTQSAPRTWTPLELSLVTETAERTWATVERARAEAALQQSEARLRSVFESIDEGFCIAEMIFDANDRPIDYRFLQANPLFEQQTGLTGAIGRTARELVPDLEEWWFETYGCVALTGESVRFEHESVPMGRWFDVYASRIGGPASRQVAIVFNNITARKAAEAQVRAALAAEQTARRAAEAASGRSMSSSRQRNAATLWPTSARYAPSPPTPPWRSTPPIGLPDPTEAPPATRSNLPRPTLWPC